MQCYGVEMSDKLFRRLLIQFHIFTLPSLLFLALGLNS